LKNLTKASKEPNYDALLKLFDLTAQARPAWNNLAPSQRITYPQIGKIKPRGFNAKGGSGHASESHNQEF